MNDPMEFLAQANTLLEAIDMQLNELNNKFLETKDLSIKEKFSALQQYRNSIFNKGLISKHRTVFNELYTVFDKKLPEMTFSLDGNKKSFKSFWEKLVMHQKKHLSIDSLYKDIHRFRVVITNSNNDNEESIQMLYQATLVTIEYFLSKDYILCKPGDLHDTDNFNPEEHPDVFVPNESIIPEAYTHRIKDYVASPKKNGYQSIHLLFSCAGDMFEIQLRTFAMHVRAEYKNSAHAEFKKMTREISNWDLSKISVNGFQFVQVKVKNPETDELILKEEILDNVGVVKPVETFVRRKTF